MIKSTTPDQDLFLVQSSVAFTCVIRTKFFLNCKDVWPYVYIGTSEIQLDRLPPPLLHSPLPPTSVPPPPILHHLHPLPFTHNNGHKITGHLSQGVNQVLTTGVNQVLTTGVNQVLTTGVTQVLTTGVNQVLTTGVNQILTTGVNQY